MHNLKIEDITNSRIRNLYENLNKECKPLLKNIYAKGNLDILNKKRIGVVGSRKMTDYGRKIVKDLASKFIELDIVVVSGLMYGVDLEIQKAIVERKGHTIGVLGYGFGYLNKNFYVQEFLKEAFSKDRLLLLTEFEEEQTPQVWTFPKRNRIVAALSDILIIVEAGKGSGTIITADLGLEIGKDVYVIPGPIYSEESYGCNKLLAEGASPLYDLDSLSSIVGIELLKQKTTPFDMDLTSNAALIYEYLLLNRNNLPVDKYWVMKNTLTSANEFSIALSELELENIIYIEGDIIGLN